MRDTLHKEVYMLQRACIAISVSELGQTFLSK